MENTRKRNSIRARRKILPALGGIKENYIRNGNCLQKTLIFLAEKLDEIENFEKERTEVKSLIKKIKNDLLLLSELKNKKAIEFYFDCSNILNNY